MTYYAEKRHISIVRTVFFNVLVICILLSLSDQLFASSSVSQDQVSVTPASEIRNPIIDYSLDVKAESVLVIETGRGMRLYMKSPDLITNIPIASKLMTALLSVESIPAETMVTISSVAAQQDDANELSLKAGEKYDLDYLLYGLILKDNDAAAIALAEQISGTQEKFVELMNTKAVSYQMTATSFRNPTGAFHEEQYTTVSDVARLFRFAVSLPKLDTILKTRDSVFILSPKLTKHLISDSADIWTLAEGSTGVFVSTKASSTSFSVTAKSGQMNIFVIGVTTSAGKTSDDITRIISSVFNDYEYSTLAVSGQTFPETMTVGDETFTLRFGSTINYVHPKSVAFIRETRYEPGKDITPPILTTKSVAKVTFVLLDGTTITADLFPSVNIWSDSTLFQKMIDIYEGNKDILHIAGVLFAFLILIAVINGIRITYEHLSSRISRSDRPTE